MISLKQTVAPAIEPVTLAEAKEQMRVLHEYEDDYITGLITAARIEAEKTNGRSFITQEWRVNLDSFPCSSTSSILIPNPPLQTIDSVTYYDSSGTQQTWAASNYIVDSDSEPARLTPAYGVTWPTAQSRPNAVSIAFTAGFGDAAEDVPEEKRLAIKILTALFYENREPIVTGTIVSEIPYSALVLLSHDKVWRFV